MAVIGVEQTVDTHWVRSAEHRGASASEHINLRMILTGPLPSDVIETEVTVTVLFRGSLALNFLTGGAPHMTFSARCHRARRTTRSPITRAGWHVLARTIDASCGILRGESEHCAAAWSNHLARGPRRRRSA